VRASTSSCPMGAASSLFPATTQSMHSPWAVSFRTQASPSKSSGSSFEERRAVERTDAADEARPGWSLAADLCVLRTYGRPMEDELTKVHVELPNHGATGGESLWAKPLGDDLYQLDNVPFHAYGLNYGDVVRATEDSPELKPEIREVVRPSGHQTIRVFFEQ